MLTMLHIIHNYMKMLVKQLERRVVLNIQLKSIWIIFNNYRTNRNTFIKGKRVIFQRNLMIYFQALNSKRVNQIVYTKLAEIQLASVLRCLRLRLYLKTKMKILKAVYFRVLKDFLKINHYHKIINLAKFRAAIFHKNPSLTIQITQSTANNQCKSNKMYLIKQV